jgi:hypothetical protein
MANYIVSALRDKKFLFLKQPEAFPFEYEIHLHIDDLNLLKFICEILSVGRVYARESSKSCSFVVGNEEGIRSLMKIFDRYTFNGIKLLRLYRLQRGFLKLF